MWVWELKVSEVDGVYNGRFVVIPIGDFSLRTYKFWTCFKLHMSYSYIWSSILGKGHDREQRNSEQFSPWRRIPLLQPSPWRRIPLLHPPHSDVFFSCSILPMATYSSPVASSPCRRIPLLHHSPHGNVLLSCSILPMATYSSPAASSASTMYTSHLT